MKNISDRCCVHLSGFNFEDTHSVANSLRWGPDGWLYGAIGSTVTTDIVRPGIDKEPLAHIVGQGIWRYHPASKRFELFAEGGGNTFILPNECRAFVTIVYLPGEDVAAVKATVEEHLAAIARTDQWLADHLPEIVWNPAEFPIVFLPIDYDPSDPGAPLLAECLEAVAGRPVPVSGRDAIMDGGWLHAAGIPTVVFGPGDKRVIHQPDEYVEIDDVIVFAKVCALFLTRWCGLKARST